MERPCTLLLLRHASAEDSRPGHGDADRRLSPRGEREADDLGAFWAGPSGTLLPPVGRALCSPAVRTRQTLERLRLDAPVEWVPAIYAAGGDELWRMAVEADVPTVLVVGHAPAVPGLVADLTDPSTAVPAAADALSTRYPPATLAVLRLPEGWEHPEAAVLSGVWLAAPAPGRFLHDAA